MATASAERDESVAVIGGGNMGGALLKGLIAKAGISPARITVCDNDPLKRERLRAELGIAATEECGDAVRGADVIVISVKPGIVPAVCALIAPELAGRAAPPLVVSVAAGVTMAELRRHLGEECRLVRVMPSIPCMIGEGVAGLVAENPDDALLVKELLAGLGASYELPSEPLIDVFTALGASAPAFLFLVLEALTEGAVRMGLARESAAAIAAEMMHGSAALVMQSGIHPAKLREMVASPGGTTVAGLQVLESAAVRGTFMEAIEAAVTRARELGAPK